MVVDGVNRGRREAGTLVRSVSSVTFEISGADPFDRTVRAAVGWMRARNPAVPPSTEDGLSFDVGGGGASVARATMLPIPDGRIWSATSDVPDYVHIGRTWTTEITVAELRGETHFGARLLNFTRGEDAAFTPSVPRLVRDLINELPCLADGEMLHDDVKVLATPQDVDDMCGLLERPNRRLPVIVLAAGVTRQPFVALETLTRRLVGAAHVLGLTDECSTLLRARVGKDLSVFDGAVRMYRPGLQFDEADPYDHPLWLAHPGRSPTDGAPVISRVLASGVAKGTTDYPRFEAVRQAAAERTIEEHRSVATDTELARILEAQATTLREQLESLREEQNQWLADEERERSSAEQQIAELRAEFRRVRAQNESLRAAMESGDAPAIVKVPLTDLETFGTWAASNISPNVWFAPKAIKETERNVQYRNPEEIGAALYALDELYVPMRQHPDDERHRVWMAKMTDLGITLTPCFTRDGDIQRYPDYSVQYRGQKRWCDLHVRHGGGTDPRAMFRIYFHWDEDEGVLLVGHMPTHLDNNMTN